MATNYKKIAKPIIIVLSKDDDDTFSWLSDGWNRKNIRNNTKAKKLFAAANAAIEAGKNVLNTIECLKKAGFEVVRAG